MKACYLLLACCAVACTGRTESVLTLGAPDEDPIDDTDELTGDENQPLPADAETPNPSLCSIANLALCDGFEQQQVQSPPWFFVNIAANLTLDQARVYRGGRALHVQADAAPDMIQAVRQGELTETAVVPQDAFFARLFVYVQSPLPGPDFRMLGLLQAEGPNLGPMLFIHGGALELNVNDVNVSSTTALPLDRWVCLEWYVQSAVAGTMQFWVDGVEVADLAYSGDTTRSPAVGRFSFGAAVFGDSVVRTPLDLWYDEVALDDARIGCAR